MLDLRNLKDKSSTSHSRNVSRNMSRTVQIFAGLRKLHTVRSSKKCVKNLGLLVDEDTTANLISI
jgi:hypothetical protein